MKRALALIGILFLLACASWLCVTLLNAGISADHARREIGLQREAAGQLRSMLMHTTQGMSRADLKRLLADDVKSASVVKEESEKIAIGSVVFYFKDNLVSGVTIIFDDPNY